LAACVSSDYRYVYTAYHFQMQKPTTFQNTLCCLLATFEHNGCGEHLVNMTSNPHCVYFCSSSRLIQKQV